MTVGYFVGSFDMLDVVDLDLIAQARSQCSRLIVGVYTDAAVADTVGRPPVMPLSERMTLLLPSPRRRRGDRPRRSRRSP